MGELDVFAGEDEPEAAEREAAAPSKPAGKLQLATQLCRALMNSTPDAVFIVDHQGTIGNANAQGLKMLEFSSGKPGEAPSKHTIDELLPTMRNISAMIKEGKAVVNFPLPDHVFNSSERMFLSTYPVRISAAAKARTSIVKISDSTTRLKPQRPAGSGPASSSLATFDTLIGTDARFQTVKHNALSVAPSNTRVLIMGNVGTGKTSLAEAIHVASNLEGPLIQYHCMSLPPKEAVPALFGTRKNGDVGLLEQAHGGTLLLDEIDELPFDIQASLVMTLDRKQTRRFGGSKFYDANFRLIATTKRDLADMVEEGAFRKDLYYRVASLVLHLPDLTARPNDIIPLAERFAQDFCSDNGLLPVHLSREVKDAFKRYSWPGNVRQLKIRTKAACRICRNREVMLDNLHEDILSELFADEKSPTSDIAPMFQSLKDAEYHQIIATLQETDYNVTEAARRLSIGRSTLYRRIHQYGITW